jgi:Spy/CpxP family protein refolding chaperone
MIKKLTILSVALSGLLLAQPQAWGLRAGYLKRQLSLSDDQVKQLRDLRRQQAEQLKPQREQVQSAAEQLRTLMKGDNPDPTAVGRQMVELKRMRQSLTQARSSYNEKAKAILTPEQQTKLEQLRKNPPRQRPLRAKPGAR